MTVRLERIRRNNKDGKAALAGQIFRYASFSPTGSCKITLMNSSALAGYAYFPAIVRVECDSPIDALLALRVPRHEAMDLVAASWRETRPTPLLAILDGGRPVVVLRTPEGRWAGCNAFLGKLCASHEEANRRLGKLLKRCHRGYVACLPAAQTVPDASEWPLTEPPA